MYHVLSHQTPMCLAESVLERRLVTSTEQPASVSPVIINRFMLVQNCVLREVRIEFVCVCVVLSVIRVMVGKERERERDVRLADRHRLSTTYILNHEQKIKLYLLLYSYI